MHSVPTRENRLEYSFQIVFCEKNKANNIEFYVCVGQVPVMCELLSDELPMLSYLSREARNLSPYPMADLKDEAWEVRQDAPPAPLAAAIQHSQSNDQLNPQLSFAFVYKAVGSYTSMQFSESCVENVDSPNNLLHAAKNSKVSVFLSIRQFFPLWPFRDMLFREKVLISHLRSILSCSQCKLLSLVHISYETTALRGKCSRFMLYCFTPIPVETDTRELLC